MDCHIGSILIVRNEGTIIFGDVSSLPTNNTGSNPSDSGEVSLDNNRFNLTIPIKSIVPDVMTSKRKKK